MCLNLCQCALNTYLYAFNAPPHALLDEMYSSVSCTVHGTVTIRIDEVRTGMLHVHNAFKCVTHGIHDHAFERICSLMQFKMQRNTLSSIRRIYIFMHCGRMHPNAMIMRVTNATPCIKYRMRFPCSQMYTPCQVGGWLVMVCAEIQDNICSAKCMVMHN